VNLGGKIALVTGGTDGIGIHIARQLFAKGVKVIVCGRREDRLAAARAEGLEAITADLSSASGVAALAKQMKGRPIDILINNAGMGATYLLDEPIDLAEKDQAIFLNLNAPIHLIAHMIDQLKARPAATIVNVTSGLAIAPNARSAVYCATKAGLRSFTKSKMEPAVCARQIVSAIEAGRSEARIGMVKILQLVHSVSPRLAGAVMIRY
jgi:uncharacterized oxidoreductase